jgi:hypothetical protein
MSGAMSQQPGEQPSLWAGLEHLSIDERLALAQGLLAELTGQPVQAGPATPLSRVFDALPVTSELGRPATAAAVDVVAEPALEPAIETVSPAPELELAMAFEPATPETGLELAPATAPVTASTNAPLDPDLAEFAAELGLDDTAWGAAASAPLAEPEYAPLRPGTTELAAPVDLHLSDVHPAVDATTMLEAAPAVVEPVAEVPAEQPVTEAAPLSSEFSFEGSDLLAAPLAEPEYAPLRPGTMELAAPIDLQLSDPQLLSPAPEPTAELTFESAASVVEQPALETAPEFAEPVAVPVQGAVPTVGEFFAAAFAEARAEPKTVADLFFDFAPARGESRSP